MSRALAPIVAAGLVGSVVLANVLSSHYGLVSAGFGLMVSAGTYAAGLSLGLRDALTETGGYRWVLGAIAVGIAISALLADGRIALASAVAFGLAELLDLAVYSRLRTRSTAAAPARVDDSGHGAYRPGTAGRAPRWRAAVAASNAVGAVVDTLLFLSIAGFPITAQSVGGQLLVKAVWMTLLALVVGEVIARTARRVTA